MREFNYYLVVDLEATCSNDGSLAKEEMEVIEIGAVMVDASSLAICDEYQAFIKPVRYPKLSGFCKELTTIRQEDVDEADNFVEVFADFRQWLSTYEGYILSSWGAYDDNQLRQDCHFHQIKYPFCRHLNLKNVFSDKQHLKKRYGLNKALQKAGLELKGTHHRGIDDARNIASLLPFIVGDKEITSN